MRSWDLLSRRYLKPSLLAFGLLLLTVACSSGRLASVDAQELAAQLAAQSPLLPGLPMPGVSRRQISAASYTFRAADQYEETGATWQDLQLTLAAGGLTYSILGRNVGASQPTSVHLTGELNNVALGISDYEHGCWLWLGEYNADADVSVPPGNYTNTDGMLYVALVCPGGSDTVQTTTLVFGDELDTAPPVWQGGVGIESAYCDYYDGVISWHPAVDAESAPVEYVIYFAESVDGIDWAAPHCLVPGEITSTRVGLYSENPTDFDFAVRARDAVGNLTTNTNFVTAFNTDGMKLPIVPWELGDKFVMGSYRPELEFTFMLLHYGPGEYLEGGPQDIWELNELLEFSPSHVDSGLSEEWVTLTSAAPQGPYTVEARVRAWNSDTGETVYFRLEGSEGLIKHDFGNYTIKPGIITGFDMATLAHGPWPRDLDWVPGDVFEISWDDPAADVNLMIESPSYSYGYAGGPDDLIDEIEFSPDSMDSGEAYESATLLPGGWPGVFTVELQYYEYDGTPPDFVTISMQLTDSEGSVKADLGSLELPFEDGVWPLAQLHNWPE